MFLFPSDASSSQWPSGLAKDISPKIFSTAKHDHQHDEQSSPKHAMDQKLLSHAAVIDMKIFHPKYNKPTEQEVARDIE
ncbi:hypothetical protein PHYBLDRAFT_179777 [Phycomyces blakesleeanus NRRL 1555(-)]|uniref:Uncharacterized protein n=1 Tax=Phycomyces blakesleeanus (strain ATCC 8743b / DSM 1359 / FGSC 10004 / NBRC 33097 / NRRL 1555) TaxID=763407 RepID=A0A167Q4R9_PHYB8|nr:hypothetical protein PHYBLDRAFT_179777 [Phycomyces blakesleeanus NRRL 1555(-)]OAD79068.1 hypothetical protein PHYBLDRAFT_179777 [Phycomyces blakesleeanus NRRL 1555(-)]|eukprot:XP_018297108.1 hypothetical protein PHYBLDRAFT_179777 [Phycomyces blakesleeanus NRRL 1555(-)]